MDSIHVRAHEMQKTHVACGPQLSGSAVEEVHSFPPARRTDKRMLGEKEGIRDGVAFQLGPFSVMLAQDNLL